MAGERQSLFQRYLSFDGRLNRELFWLRQFGASLLLTIFSIPFFVLAIYALGASGDWRLVHVGDEFVPLPIFLVFLFLAIISSPIFFSLCARRLHDRNRSAWWLLLWCYFFPFAAWPQNPEQQPAPMFVIGIFILIVPMSWLFFEMFLLRGTNGPNRYGPDPLDPASGNA